MLGVCVCLMLVQALAALHGREAHAHLETAGATILLLLCLAQQIQGAQGTKIANGAELEGR